MKLISSKAACLMTFSFLILSSCNPQQEKSSDDAPNIEALHWMLGNIPTSHWSGLTTATAFSNFRITLSTPSDIEDIKVVRVTNDSGAYFETYNQESDYTPDEIEDGTWLFDCNCWFYYGATPNQAPLGEYIVEVETFSGEEVTSSFFASSIDTEITSGDIYSPESFPNENPLMLYIPELVSFDVFSYGVDLVVNLNDPIAQSYNVFFFNASGSLSAVSDYQTAGSGNTSAFLGSTSIAFVTGNDYSDLYSAYIYSYPNPNADVLELRNHVAISPKVVRSSYTEPNSNNSDPAATLNTIGKVYKNVPYTFDASGSSDPEDAGDLLEVRWDLDGDGVYDTQFSNEKTYTHNYTEETTSSFKVTVQVRDTNGATDTDYSYATVRPEPIGQLIELDYSLLQIEYDKLRDLVYTLDEESDYLRAYSATSGELIKALSLGGYPRKMHINHDESGLYVGSQISPYTTSSVSKVDQESNFLTVDLSSWNVVDTFYVDSNIFDIAVSTSGIAYITGAGNYDSTLDSWDLDTGTIIDSLEVGHANNITMTPDETAIYGGGTVNDYMQKWTIDSVGNIDYVYYDSNYQAGKNGTFIIPEGNLMFGFFSEIMEYGSDTQSGDKTEVNAVWSPGKEVHRVDFDQTANLALVYTRVFANDIFVLYDYKNFEIVSEHPTNIELHTVENILMGNTTFIARGSIYSTDYLNIINRE